MEALKRFVRDESALETVEWAFILGFVILGAVLALIGARGHMINIFTKMANEMITAESEVAAGL